MASRSVTKTIYKGLLFYFFVFVFIFVFCCFLNWLVHCCVGRPWLSASCIMGPFVAGCGVKLKVVIFKKNSSVFDNKVTHGIE